MTQFPFQDPTILAVARAGHATFQLVPTFPPFSGWSHHDVRLKPTSLRNWEKQDSFATRITITLNGGLVFIGQSTWLLWRTCVGKLFTKRKRRKTFTSHICFKLEDLRCAGNHCGGASVARRPGDERASITADRGAQTCPSRWICSEIHCIQWICNAFVIHGFNIREITILAHDTNAAQAIINVTFIQSWEWIRHVRYMSEYSMTTRSSTIETDTPDNFDLFPTSKTMVSLCLPHKSTAISEGESSMSAVFAVINPDSIECCNAR